MNPHGIVWGWHRSSYSNPRAGGTTPHIWIYYVSNTPCRRHGILVTPHGIVWGSAQEQSQQHACRRHDTSYMDILCLQRPVSKTRHPINPTRHRVGARHKSSYSNLRAGGTTPHIEM